MRAKEREKHSFHVAEGIITYPVATLSVDKGMRCVKGGRDDVTAQCQVRVGGTNLGQRLATAQAGERADGSHFEG